jgi:hypothetical protein
MRLDNGQWERWITSLLALLAADAHDQITWSTQHEARTAAVAEDVEFSLQLAKAMTNRGALDAAVLRDLEKIGHLSGKAAQGTHVSRWADAVQAEPAWEEIRALARRILIDHLGTWSRPLPHHVLPQQGYD